MSLTASLRYDDGKTLKGIGTLASKSRLTDSRESFLECLSNRYGNNSKGRQEETLASWGGKGKKRGDEGKVKLTSCQRHVISLCLGR